MTLPRSLLIKYALFFSGMAVLTVSFIGTDKDISTENVKEITVDFRGVAKKAIPAVVSIRVQTSKKPSFWGQSSDDSIDLFGNNLWKFFNIPEKSQKVMGQASGVIISPDGYILTNSHVVNDMDSINVKLHDGREFPAKVLGQDKSNDLALIKIEASNLPYLKLSNSNDLEVGQWIAAIGNPFGLQGTLSVGVVSAKGRNNLDIVRNEDFIQTDASINAGNSGGPLVNLNGEIVGINTAIATNSSEGYLGIGFAIPSNMARYVVDEIKDKGHVSRGYLGVNLQSIDYNLAQAFNLEKIEGALVTNVQKNSPADTAGMKAEDVILKYDNHPIENASTLSNAIYMLHPGTKIVLTVLREGKTIQIPIEVIQYPDEEPKSNEGYEKTQVGIEVDNLTPELAQSLGYNDMKGVIVTKVQTGSAASLAGLKKGTLVLSVNRNKVTNKDQFYKEIKSTPKGKPVLFQVKQGDVNAFISIRLD